MCGQGHGCETESYGHAINSMLLCHQEQYPHINFYDQQSMLWCYVHLTGHSNDPSLLSVVPRDETGGPSDSQICPREEDRAGSRPEADTQCFPVVG